MADPFIGEIRMFGFDFAPRNWAVCNGALLAISQNTALFSILGTTYGGNGAQTFGLPNLQGRAPMHFGTGPGLTPRNLGETGGSETVTLSATQLPQHNHIVNATNAAPNQGSPSGNNWATGNYSATGNAAMSGQAIAASGGSQPHENRHPYTVVNFCICLFGIFPSRN